MFHKPFSIKSQSVLKGSDRKKIRSTITSQCSLFTADIIQQIIPQKTDVQLARVAVHSGDVIGVILTEKQPVFFELCGYYYPTVYTAWNYPDCVTSFNTHSLVITKIYGGADLMLPGVVCNEELSASTFSHIIKGQVMAVSAVGNRAALAIGESCMDGRSMVESGMRGKGVIIRHFHGDHLWAMGTKVSPPQIAEPVLKSTSEDEPPQVDGSDPNQPDVSQLSITSDPVLTEAPDSDAGACASAAASAESGADDSVFAGLTPDEQLKQCFLYALKKKLKQPQLPLTTSTFYRDFVQACCPEGVSLDIKKTSYKKLMPFLKEMQTLGLIKVQETSKGVHSIVGFDPAHSDVRSLRVWELPDVEDTTPDSTQEYRYEPPEIIELLAVNAQTLPIFSRLGFSKGDSFSTTDMRRALTEYIKHNKLQSTENKQLVMLDDALTQAVITKKDGYVESLQWNQLFNRLIAALGNVYEMRFPTGAVVSKKGKPVPIQAKVVTRSGNKKVTIIENLDKFAIDEKMISKDLRTLKACNSTVQETATGKTVLAQGNHTAFLQKLLKEKYRIPIKYLDIPT